MVSSQLFFIFLIILNSIIYLTAQYEGYPQTGASRLQSPLKGSIELKCRYNGMDENGEFLEWFKQNATHDVSVHTDKPGHYVVKNTDKESILTIKIFVLSDAKVIRWYAKTKKQRFETPSECQFSQISLIPSPQGIQDNKGEILDTAHASIRRTEDQSINLKCLIEPADTNRQNPIKWQYSTDEKTFSDLPFDIIKNGNEIQIDAIKKDHRGYYRCTLNNVSFTVLLRVKDRLAALWPFIGILSIVLVLVIIILIFEKRQKSNKKNVSNDDDEQDRASDPLVRTTIKTSDNDNKKRAIKT